MALHEVGHALAAAAYGIRTRDITLYPVGGVASLERMPEKPGQEVAVALAGPAVNVVIAGGLVLGLFGGGLALPWELTTDLVVDFIHQVFFANVMLCAFNLLPAFPMDGGRVLRALLATRMPRLRATEVAVKSALPEGETKNPVAGFLYFPYRGKVKGIKTLELVYDRAVLKLR